ncbi:hypothetical protein LAZ67_2005376 [Cordylochernes scorpioides]|uniref:Integrase catalytic domain-containing protein n=1 Tax=Cordylochernes scorpioides TaxID=51811 RepID=A0ABY6K5Y5_9ARAC|nr:hypothetical protein LAZ67_2005376 [Cordylochernes scorpioides]
MTTQESPEQNGIAERFNRTGIEGVHALLLDSGLQARFWAEALNTFVYTKNRCEHALTKGVSPIELWLGHKPSWKNIYFNIKAINSNLKCSRSVHMATRPEPTSCCQLATSPVTADLSKTVLLPHVGMRLAPALPTHMWAILPYPSIYNFTLGSLPLGYFVIQFTTGRNNRWSSYTPGSAEPNNSLLVRRMSNGHTLLCAYVIVRE